VARRAGWLERTLGTTEEEELDVVTRWDIVEGNQQD